MKPLIILTGATGGMGSYIFKKLSKQNFPLLLVAKNKDNLVKLINDYNCKEAVYTLIGDFLDTDIVSKFGQIIREISSKHTVYGLINVAGWNGISNWRELQEQEWENVFRINVEVPMFLIQEFAKILIENNWEGSIINITSSVVHKGSKKPHYCASKTALSSLSKTLSIDFGKNNIRINSICPSGTLTKMLRGWDKEKILQISQKNPIQRLGKTDDVWNVVNFLLSKKSGFITGQEIIINGGEY